jgi:hypothetical protein
MPNGAPLWHVKLGLAARFTLLVMKMKLVAAAVAPRKAHPANA